MRFLEDDMMRLRAVEPEDAAELWEIETDSRQWLENGMMAPYSRHNLKEYAETYDADPIRSGQLRLIINIKKEKPGKCRGDIAGIVDLYDISASGRTALIGIYVREEFRNNGIGTHALRLTEEYARLLLNLRMTGAKISGTNKSSIRLFENAGYKKAGELPGWLMSGNNTFPLLIFIKEL